MIQITGHITIGKYRFVRWKSVEINSGYENLTDTATITVPRKLSFEGQKLADGESLFRRGDKVSIVLGYNGQNSEVFQGYIAEIMPCHGAAAFVTFKCEDAMWLLKQQRVAKAYNKVSLRQLLADILPAGINFTAMEVNLGSVRINNTTVAKVLADLLKDQYGIYSWMRDGRLYSGLAYSLEAAGVRRGVFRFGHNIVNSDQLAYRQASETKVQVIVESHVQQAGKDQKLQATAGTPGGDVITMRWPNGDLDTMQQIADNRLAKYSSEGYTGTFQTFGMPAMRHGDVVVFEDPENTRPAGNYRIAAVTTTSDDNGFWQQITLGPKVL